MARLLLIEDDRETADEIRAELGDRGFDVDWAANGIEGLDKARAGRAEALIVDRLLPGMDGLTIVEALRQDGVRTPTGRTPVTCSRASNERTKRSASSDGESKMFRSWIQPCAATSCPAEM